LHLPERDETEMLESARVIVAEHDRIMQVRYLEEAHAFMPPIV